jgi:hypothetical protein
VRLSVMNADVIEWAGWRCEEDGEGVSLFGG